MSDVRVIETTRGPVSLARSGSGPDLIMLHSLLSDRHVFDPVIEDLGERWTVNLVDLPGFGSTPRVGPSINAYADVIGALLRAGDYDPGATAVLGNGLGAFVALGTAIRHGQLFDRLVLVGCGVSFTEESKSTFRAMIERVQQAGMDGVVDVAVRRIFSEEFLAMNTDVLAERVEVLRRTDPGAFQDACAALIGMDYRSAVSDVGNPTLIVVGTEDQATAPAMAHELHAALTDSRLVEMDGIAHAPQLQAPGDFLAAIAPFL